MNMLLAACLAIMLSFPGLAAAAGQAVDTAFLREEPYSRTKSWVDPASIDTEHKRVVIRDAINPIARFLVGMSFVRLPPAIDSDFLTDHGRAVLRRPPVRNIHKRYAIGNVRNWHVCGDKAVSFNAVFYDLLRKNSWQEDFLFLKTNDGWRFENHRRLHCEAPEEDVPDR